MSKTEVIFCNNSYLIGEPCHFSDKKGVKVIYEVVRVMEGVPLFLADHMHRLAQSACKVGYTKALPDSSLLVSIFRNLVEKNNRETGNIQLNLEIDNPQIRLYASFIPHIYPTPAQYEKGVSTGLLFAERKNPEAKIIQSQFRKRANDMIREKNLFEIFLVDRHRQVTEGSRSNLFIIENGTLYTAPANIILEGITRNKVIQIAMKSGIPVIEKAWDYQEILEKAEALFITGTSPKILPVARCEGSAFEVNHRITRKLMDEYDQCLKRYIQNPKPTD
ncbi:MAG: aminotransferase class IV [Bacteroidales bacterium]|nr:aminotransferase class IV [Bacteroidales bacterium]MDD2324166.1 aminotransferase class IV [Bacteroidales bacterium]MDD3010370.1 aminotransferase class IV [Bacteroidales bacterium]MDD3962014.1 aminotransferase class IV [Bacteroidales bacterium]MDY0285083.1 aminotransferase class IV [Bacteroidales bacterium]